MKAMDPQERERWKEFKAELRSWCNRATNYAVLETLGSHCRRDEDIVDEETYRERLKKSRSRGNHTTGGGIEQSLWMLRLRRRGGSSNRELDDDDANLITKYAKNRIRGEKQGDRPPQFADNIQDLLMKITSQFTDHINDAMHSDEQSPAISVQKNDTLAAVMQLEAIEANMNAIDHDMAILDSNRKSGEDFEELLVGFGCSPDDYSSSEVESSSDDGDGSDSDDESLSDDESESDGSESESESDDSESESDESESEADGDSDQRDDDADQSILVDDSARMSSGSDDTEVDELMKQMALEMGISLSKFDAAIGEDSDHYSSEYDSDSDDESNFSDEDSDGATGSGCEDDGESLPGGEGAYVGRESPHTPMLSSSSPPANEIAKVFPESVSVVVSQNDRDSDEESEPEGEEGADSEDEGSDSEYHSDESSISESLLRELTEVLGYVPPPVMKSNDCSTPRITEDDSSCDEKSVVPTENMTESSVSSATSENKAKRVSLEDFFCHEDPLSPKTHLQKEGLCLTEDKSCIISRESKEDDPTIDFSIPSKPFEQGDSKRLLHGLSLSNGSLHFLNLDGTDEIEAHEQQVNDESKSFANSEESSLSLRNDDHVRPSNTEDRPYRAGDLVCGWDDESGVDHLSSELLVDWNGDCHGDLDESHVHLPTFEPPMEDATTERSVSSVLSDGNFMPWPDRQASDISSVVEQDSEPHGGSASSVSENGDMNYKITAEDPNSQILSAQLPSEHGDMVWHVEIVKEENEKNESPFAFRLDPDVLAGKRPPNPPASSFPKISFSAKLTKKKSFSAPKNKHFDMMEDDKSKRLEQQKSRRRMVRRGSRVQFLKGLNYMAPTKARAVAMTMR